MTYVTTNEVVRVLRLPKDKMRKSHEEREARRSDWFGDALQKFGVKII